MSYLAAAVKQYNEYDISLTGGVSGSVAVTHGENLNYCTIEILGYLLAGSDGSGGAGGTPASGTVYLTTSGGTITANKYDNGAGGNGGAVKVSVTEWFPRTMRQPVQRGTLTNFGSPADSAAYTATGLKTQIKHLGNSSNTGASVLGNTAWRTTVFKKDSTHVTVTSSGSVTFTTGFEVVDWK